MSMQFADRQDAIKYLGEKLSRALPSDLGLGNEIASSLVEVFLVQAEAGTTSDRRAVFAPARWVIRDQDLDLLGNVGSILQGTATAGVLVHATHAVGAGLATPAVLIATYVAKLVISLYKRGVRLNKLGFAVLRTLREYREGLTTAQLQASLKRDGHDLPIEEIEVILKKLSHYPSASGDINLVWCSHDDHWHTKDV